jgi:phosphoribosylaminoimidazolecarboxamide formyltransferase/IMP cyclohydrolase
MARILRALISVYDKEGIVQFAKVLEKLGIEIISTGGTAKLLQKEGIKVIKISEYTESPEMLDGRVKTLHPKIHSGLLAIRENKKHMEELEKYNTKPIDLVVVNLYPFEDTVSKENVKLTDAVEEIDIGGVTLLRAGAKNYKNVGVVVNPKRYDEVLKELKEKSGELSEKMKINLALEALRYIAHYDTVISNFFDEYYDFKDFPEFLNLTYKKIQDLRYGENPHQKGAFYKELREYDTSIANAKQIQGKVLSYNNTLDANSALECLKELNETAVVIVKHNNPCGVAVAEKLVDAYKKAKATDPEAAFGGVVALNRTVDAETAKEITSLLTDVVLAPNYTKEALQILAEKRNMRVLEVGEIKRKKLNGREVRSVVGGLLAQERDMKLLDGLKVVTERKPTEKEMKALLFVWKVCKHVKSNAIVYGFEDRTVGIGAGQMKRVDSSKLGAMKATESLKGAVLASDAFFPFSDSVEVAAQAGVTAIIQPGGSLKDKEVIEACNKHNIAMVFTGIRHFRH